MGVSQETSIVVVGSERKPPRKLWYCEDGQQEVNENGIAIVSDGIEGRGANIWNLVIECHHDDVDIIRAVLSQGDTSRCPYEHNE